MSAQETGMTITIIVKLKCQRKNLGLVFGYSMPTLNLRPLFENQRLRFENTALFLQLGLSSTLISQEDVAFHRHCSDGELWKHQYCILVLTETILKTTFSENNDATLIMKFH